MFPVFYIFALFLCLLCYYLYKLQYPKHYEKLNGINGPKNLPFVGSLLEFYGKNSSELRVLVDEIQNRYKSPLLIKFLDVYVLEIYKAEHAEQLLRSKTNTAKNSIYQLVHCWLGQGLITSSGEQWFKQRKLLTPAFHFQILRDFSGILNKHALALVEHVDACMNTSATMDVTQPITLMALDAICETSMGSELHALAGGDDTPYAAAIARFSETFVERAVKPWLWRDFVAFNFSSVGRRLKRDLAILHGFTEKVLSERLAEAKEGQSAQTYHQASRKKRPLALLDCLLQLYKDGSMSLQEVREQVDTFMFAGHDTTATAIMWFCYCMGRNPEIQRELQDEIDSVLGADMDEHVTMDQLAEMPLLERCLKESQRLYPSVPVIGRMIEQPLVLDAHTPTIPAGVQIELFITKLHRDPQHFPEPHRFDPDRFLPDAIAGRHPFAFVPFSAGPRNCIGQTYARMEVKTTMCHLLRHFTLRAEQTPEDLAPEYKLVFRPAKPLLIAFERRSTNF